MPSSNLRPENPDEEDNKKVYRQTIMFSATMPTSVYNLSKKYLRRPVVITIGDRKAAVDSVEQRFLFVSEGEKRRKLLEVCVPCFVCHVCVDLLTDYSCDDIVDLNRFWKRPN